VTHKGRFQRVGTCINFTVGACPIFLILSEDARIRAFHNVCRHRGYPVATKDVCYSMGKIGCGYHGWTYNTLGDLIKVSRLRELDNANWKAPSYDQLSQFNKNENNLFPIHVHVSEQGLIFVNLSSDPHVTPFHATFLPR
jgi:phenylpropionate dioxygenase-like ring-hydroxylating dioxygenase large terminal subunit